MLPKLQPHSDDGLRPAFCNLCKLFQSFDDACPPSVRFDQHDLLRSISDQLCRKHSFPACDNQVQRADIEVTDSWLRVVLWKAAIPYIDGTTDPNDQGLSVSFPMSVARDLLSKLTTLPSQALESHGPGMVGHVKLMHPLVGADSFLRYLNYSRLQAPLPTSSYVPRIWHMSDLFKRDLTKSSVRWAA
jgi:hypothetical protein